MTVSFIPAKVSAFKQQTSFYMPEVITSFNLFELPHSSHILDQSMSAVVLGKSHKVLSTSSEMSQKFAECLAVIEQHNQVDLSVACFIVDFIVETGIVFRCFLF